MKYIRAKNACSLLDGKDFKAASVMIPMHPCLPIGDEVTFVRANRYRVYLDDGFHAKLIAQGNAWVLSAVDVGKVRSYLNFRQIEGAK